MTTCRLSFRYIAVPRASPPPRLSRLSTPSRRGARSGTLALRLGSHGTSHSIITCRLSEEETG